MDMLPANKATEVSALNVFNALIAGPCERHVAGWIGACQNRTSNPPRRDPLMYAVYGNDTKYRLCNGCYAISEGELAAERRSGIYIPDR